MENNPKKTHWALLRKTTLSQYTQKVQFFYKKANRFTYGWLSVLVRAWLRFNQNHAGESAAGIAFFSIFSIIPLLVFVISTASSLLTSTVVLQSIANFLDTAFPVSLKKLMDVVNSLVSTRESMNLIATLGLLWAASNMFNFILYSINRSWNTRGSRGLIKNRLLALAFVTALAVVVVVLLILLFFVRLIAGLIPGIGDSLLTLVLPLLIQASLIFLIYKFGPATAVNTKAALTGAILATLALEITTRGFTWYLNSEWSTYGTYYGPLGAIIGLLFWVFLGYWILLFGAYLSEAIFVRWNNDNPNDFFELLDFSSH
jgi:membrane protein